MAIGEFGGAPAAAVDHGPMYAAPAYWLYEMSHAALNPSRAFADAARLFFKNPANPLSHTPFGKTMAASCELFERSTRRYGKPEWNIKSTVVGGEHVAVHIAPCGSGRSAGSVHFERAFEHVPRRPQPRLLIVAPMSGHYATLLRGTVEAFLPNHDVYITEWVDARMVPLSEGRFDLDDYIDYVISMLHVLGGDVHVLGGVPAVGAGAGGGRAHGGGRRSLRAAFHGADGRPDRHAGQSDRGQHAGRAARHRLVPPQRHHQGAVSPIRASCATSIRASCSSTAS